MAKQEIVLSGGPRGGEIAITEVSPGAVFETDDGYVYRCDVDDPELAVFQGTGQKFVTPKIPSRLAAVRAAVAEAAKAEAIAKEALLAAEAENAAQIEALRARGK